MTGMTLQAHEVGSSLAARVKKLKELTYSPQGGVQNPLMRMIGLAVVEACKARDDMCELKSIFDFVVTNVRYTGDVTKKDTFQNPLRTLQFRGGDCLPLSTLVFTEQREFVPIATLQPGQKIWGDGAWAQVQESWISGEKPILAFDLDNGGVLRCSPEHRVFLADGSEVRAESIRVGQQLRTPKAAIPGAEKPLSWPGISDVDFGWLLGVYVADGWHDKSRIAISGRDGKPKEAQKRRIVNMMESAGIHTRWHERYVAINDKELANFFEPLGHHATKKHLPTLQVHASQLQSIVEGLQADGGRAVSGTFVHSTTSPEMALQLRVLYRMLGNSTHIRRVDKHGGLGTNPIYRITVRGGDAKKLADARVKAVREDGKELCGDLTVDGSRFWLPESDVVVHNCDDHAILCAALCLENGFTPKWRITSNTGSSWDHIYCMAAYPRHRPTTWVTLDTTLGAGRFDRQPPFADYRDFEVT